MAISFHSNSGVMMAQNSLLVADRDVNKSISQLSTGLRINTAADDASGIALSEKLRGQIRGLSSAHANAKSATSFLNTSESGVDTISSILTRMRELAVEASKDTYTSNDRVTLQKEIMVLNNELNRIATSSEYNGKNLLNGNAAGLWSSTNDLVDAIITGATQSGEYKLTFATDPGRNAVYSTSIFATARDAVIADPNTTTMENFRTLGGDWRALSGTVLRFSDRNTYSKATGCSLLNVAQDSSSTSLQGPPSRRIFLQEYEHNKNNTGTFIKTGGYLEIEFLDNVTFSSTAGSIAGRVKATFVDGLTGERIEVIHDNIYTGDGAIGNTNNDFQFVNSAGVAVFGTRLRLANLLGTNTITAGDKALFNVTPQINTTTGSNDIVVSSTTNNNYPPVVISNGKTGDGEFTMVMLDKDGFHEGKIRWDNSGKIFQNGDVTLTFLKAGQPAPENTKLIELTTFADAGGQLLDITKNLTIHGNNKSATIYINKDDTIASFMDKMRGAIQFELGMGASGVPLQDLVRYIQEDDVANGIANATVPATFIIQGANTGKSSEITFSGDEALIEALGLKLKQASRESVTEVVVTDVKTGMFIGRDTVTDSIVRGTVAGVDFHIKSDIGVTRNVINGTINFTKDKSTVNQTVIKIASNATNTLVGANAGQTISTVLGRLDSTSLELDKISLVTTNSAQLAITKIDKAISKISRYRTNIGGQVNTFGSIESGITHTRKETAGSESRIRDIDFAAASARFAQRQLILNSSAAMLAQANVLPQMTLSLIKNS